MATTHNRDLSDIAGQTEMLRQCQHKVERISKRRRDALLAHRNAQPPVPYADLAEAMGVSEAIVYRIIRGKDGPVGRGKSK